jgi:hypothetical protein
MLTPASATLQSLSSILHSPFLVYHFLQQSPQAFLRSTLSSHLFSPPVQFLLSASRFAPFFLAPPCPCSFSRLLVSPFSSRSLLYLPFRCSPSSPCLPSPSLHLSISPPSALYSLPSFLLTRLSTQLNTFSFFFTGLLTSFLIHHVPDASSLLVANACAPETPSHPLC